MSSTGRASGNPVRLLQAHSAAARRGSPRVDRKVRDLENAKRRNRHSAVGHEKAMLYPFKVKLHDRLSTNQAYFLIGDALKRQGIEFQEFETILMSRGAISILPKLIFGVEIECYYPVAVGQPGIVSKMSDSDQHRVPDLQSQSLQGLEDRL